VHLGFTFCNTALEVVPIPRHNPDGIMATPAALLFEACCFSYPFEFLIGNQPEFISALGAVGGKPQPCNRILKAGGL